MQPNAGFHTGFFYFFLVGGWGGGRTCVKACMRVLVYHYGFVDLKFWTETSDSAIIQPIVMLYLVIVLCTLIVAVEVIMTSFIFKFLGGNPSFPHLRMKPFRSLAPRNVKGLICETC